jgi:hypothetical protein
MPLTRMAAGAQRQRQEQVKALLAFMESLLWPGEAGGL